MQIKTIYTLKEGVQVRREVFGLLFYNYRGPRLYFVPTKNLIDSQFFEGKQTVPELVKSICSTHQLPRKWVQDHIQNVLEQLESKGLIYGQSLC